MKLPHADPILFVDEHTIIDGTDIKATYTVPADHPVLKGHFPVFPIWPGVHLIEGMNQTAGLHALHIVTQDPHVIDINLLTMVTSVDKVKFRSPVLPGAKLQYTATREKAVRNFVWYSCVAYANGVRVAEAYIGLTATAYKNWLI